MTKQTKTIAVGSSAVVLLVGLWLLRTQALFGDSMTIFRGVTEIKSLSVVIAHTTSPLALICISLFATFLAVETHHIYTWLQIAATLLVTVGFCWLIKEVTQLPRPANAQLVATGFSQYAFPSTHTASAGAVAVLAGFHIQRLTQLANRAVYPLLVVGVFVVGVSRVALDAHTISDVLAGLVIGISLGLLAAMMWPRWYQLLNQVSGHRQEIR